MSKLVAAVLPDESLLVSFKKRYLPAGAGSVGIINRRPRSRLKFHLHTDKLRNEWKTIEDAKSINLKFVTSKEQIQSN